LADAISNWIKNMDVAKSCEERGEWQKFLATTTTYIINNKSLISLLSFEVRVYVDEATAGADVVCSVCVFDLGSA